MKRIWTLLVAIVCLTALTACNGAVEEEKRQCASCGESILTDASFCGYCGASVQDREAQPDTDTVPVSEETQKTDPHDSAHTHSYARSVVVATCTKDGYEIYTCTCGDSYKANHTQAKGHSYVKNIMPATCTTQGYTIYTCNCGDTYRGDFVQPTHRYVNYTCTSCGATEPNYSGFQAEYAQLTAQYDAEIADLRSKIEQCQNNISEYERIIDSAQLNLNMPIPDCPQWFRQLFIDNYRQYGDSYTASMAAEIAWEQQCYAEKAELEQVISANQSKLQLEQDKLSTYNTMLTSCNDRYRSDVDMLEQKYGLS